MVAPAHGHWRRTKREDGNSAGSVARRSEQCDQGKKSDPKAHPRAGELNYVNRANGSKARLTHEAHHTSQANDQRDDDSRGERLAVEHGRIIDSDGLRVNFKKTPTFAFAILTRRPGGQNPLRK